MKKYLIMLVTGLTGLTGAMAQCSNGETHITVVANSYDIYGEESYWELVPAGNGCSNSTLLSGGSEEVGCAGNGPTGENGIPDFGSEPISGCISTSQPVDLVWVDWYGDGGLSFDIYLNGYHSQSFWGEGAGNTWTIDPAQDIPTPVYDSPCGAAEIMPDGALVTINTATCQAPFSELRPPGIHCSLPGTWCDSGITRTAWARFEAQENTAYRISTCNSGTSFDIRIALFTGPECGFPWEFELLSANDDQMGGCGAGNGYASGCFISCLPQATVVYIMVDGWGGQAGLAELSVETFTPVESFQAEVTNISCPAESGGPPNGLIYPWVTDAGVNFSCVWTGPGGFTSSQPYVQGLGPGTYELLLTTACGLTFTQSYTILNPEPWNVSVTTAPTECPGTGTGQLMIDAAGATPPYSYSINGPGNFASELSEVTGAVFGNYAITVTDSEGCNHLSTAFVDIADSFTFSLGEDITACLGDTLTFEAPPGLNGIWQDGSSGSNYTLYTSDFGVGDAAVILSATTDEGCSHTDVLVVTIEACVGIGEMMSDVLPVVYPNPSDGQVTIRIPERFAGKQLILTDAVGRTTLAVPSNREMKLQLDDLQPGIYLVRIEGMQAVRLVRN
jgi:hypothetical protein